jgi:hypothetical protein
MSGPNASVIVFAMLHPVKISRFDAFPSSPATQISMNALTSTYLGNTQFFHAALECDLKAHSDARLILGEIYVDDGASEPPVCIFNSSPKRAWIS